MFFKKFAENFEGISKILEKCRENMKNILQTLLRDCRKISEIPLNF